MKWPPVDQDNGHSVSVQETIWKVSNSSLLLSSKGQLHSLKKLRRCNVAVFHGYFLNPTYIPA
eukprot:812813-Pelagomonas_calceolata.AAC.7